MPEPDVPGNAAGSGARYGSELREVSPAAAPLVALTWNVEWLGDPENGPVDDMRQAALVIDALTFANADLIGLQEVSSAAAAARLAQAFPAYSLELARYAQRQKVALLVRTERLELLGVSSLDGLDDAGRPPLEARLRTRQGRELTAIVLHAKAGDDWRSYQTRKRFGEGLARELAQRHAGGDVILLGDFNDLFSSSTLEGSRSPYEALLSGGAFEAVTAQLEAQRERSTAWGQTVDHIVLSRSLAPALEPGSVEALRDELLARHPDFFEAASDHAPVTLELRL